MFLSLCIVGCVCVCLCKCIARKDFMELIWRNDPCILYFIAGSFRKSKKFGNHGKLQNETLQIFCTLSFSARALMAVSKYSIVRCGRHSLFFVHKDHYVNRLLCVVVFTNHSRFVIPAASETILARKLLQGHDENPPRFNAISTAS